MSEDKANFGEKSSFGLDDIEEKGKEDFSGLKEEKNSSFDKYLSSFGKKDISSEGFSSEDAFLEAGQKRYKSELEQAGLFSNGQSAEEVKFESAGQSKSRSESRPESKPEFSAETRDFSEQGTNLHENAGHAKSAMGEKNAFKSSNSDSAAEGQNMNFKPQAAKKSNQRVSFETPDRGTIFCPVWAELRKPWRKRHPVLFWGGVLIIVLIGLNLVLSSLGTINFGAKKIAQVNIDGIILESRSTVDWIEKVRKDKAISGVIIRVNSPGGGVTPSQEIYFAIKRLANEKNVVVSMGTLAASGGYYVSLPAQRIFAAPATITGSIGVKMELPNFKELFDFLGLSSTTLASGDLKDAGSPLKPLADKEKEYFMGVVMDMFDDFIGVVSMHRKLSADQVKTVTDGRALTGRQALKFGLVDELGDYYDAKNYLYKLCEISEQDRVVIIEGPPKKMSLLRELTESLFDMVYERSLTRAISPSYLY